MDDVTLRASFIDEASRPIEKLENKVQGVTVATERYDKRRKSSADKAASGIATANRKTEKSFDTVEKAISKSGGKSGNKWADQLTAGIRKGRDKAGAEAGKIAEKIGQNLGAKAAVIGASVGALLGGSIASAVEKETAKINLGIKTGEVNGGAGAAAGGAGAGESMAAADAVWKRGFGESRAEAANLIDTISRIPGMWDQGIEGASQFGAEVSTISGAFELDASQIGGTIETMIANGMATNAGASLDMITATLQQASPRVRDEILENVTEYSKHYDQMGLSSEQMFNLLLKGSENGIIGVDKMGDAIKELGIRATDGSKTSVAALDAIGVNGDKVMDDLASGGDKGARAFGQIVDGLKGIKDPSEQAQTAIALFGTPLEDLGVQEIPSFLDALSQGEQGLKNWEGAALNAADSVENGPAQSFEVLKRSVSDAFAELGANALPYLQPVLGFLTQYAPVLVPIAVGLGIVAAAVAAVVGVTMLWNAAMLVNPVTWVILGIVAVIALLVGGFVWAYNNVQWFKTGVDGAVNGVRGAFEGLVNWWNTSLMPVLQAVGSWFDTYLIQPIKSVVDWIGSAIDKMGGLTGMMEGIGGAVGAVGDFLGFSGGGVVPGYAPGVDSVPAVLSPGEAVLVPELTRALGADWIYSMNRRFSNGRAPGTPQGSARAAASQRFAGGGIARPTGGGGGGGTSITNVAKVTIQGNLAPGVTPADVERATLRALAKANRRTY